MPKRISKKGKFANAIAFKCYFGADHFQGYYILKTGERVSEDRRHIVSDVCPEGRLCVCPKHHPPGSSIGIQDGLHIVYALKDSENYRMEDGPIAFYDQLVKKDSGSASQGLGDEGLYGGRY